MASRFPAGRKRELQAPTSRGQAHMSPGGAMGLHYKIVGPLMALGLVGHPERGQCLGAQMFE